MGHGKKAEGRGAGGKLFSFAPLLPAPHLPVGERSRTTSPSSPTLLTIPSKEPDYSSIAPLDSFYRVKYPLVAKNHHV